MAGQVSPGIVLRERDLTAQTIVTTQANTAALVGLFEKGPVGVITSITSERELLDTFGGPNDNNYQDWFTASTFLSYGGQLLIVRIAPADALNATSDTDGTTGTGVLISSKTEYEIEYNTYSWAFAARTAGSWGNGIKVAFIDTHTPDYDAAVIFEDADGNDVLWSAYAPDFTFAEMDSCHIAVLDSDNNILELYQYLSKISTAVDNEGASLYYVNVLANRSRYVYAGAPFVCAVGTGQQTFPFGAGDDDYAAAVSDYTGAYELFADTEYVNIDFVLTGGSLSTQNNTVTKALSAISIATGRKDCIAFVSPYNNFVSLSSTSAQRDAIIAFFDQLGSSNSYTVLDSGYKYVYDRYNDVYRYVPCCGDVAGLCVQTSETLEDWYSPAGTQRGNLKGVVKLAYVPGKNDRDKLYQKRINPITSFPGQGVVLFGDKTALATPSAFDRINVRRLFLAVERRVGSLAKNVLFELNDDATRATFSNAVNSYMSEVKAKRGVTDYLVVCDESNNTPDVIDRNEFVAEIYIKPARSINFITITFVATRTGVSFAEVVGR
jgi:hypothetical protein